MTTQTAAADQNGRPRRRILRLLLAAGLAVGAVALTPKVSYLLAHESTDDAYFRATIVPVAPQVGGQVVKVAVTENQLVRAGDLLFSIDQRDYRLALTQREEALAVARAERPKLAASIVEAEKALAVAEAGLADTRASEAFAAQEKKRYADLLAAAAISRHKLEERTTAWQSASAKRQAAAAAVEKNRAAITALKAELAAQECKIKEAAAALAVAELALARTTVRAPITGRVGQKNVDPGRYVQAGQPLLALVDPGSVWLAANFKETQIGRIRAGQPVEVRVDAYPNLTLHGHVESVQAGTGAVFSLLPPENATGNFVKVVQRLPVKIVIDSPPDPAHPLWPGLSAEPSVAVTAGRKG